MEEKKELIVSLLGIKIIIVITNAAWDERSKRILEEMAIDENPPAETMATETAKEVVNDVVGKIYGALPKKLAEVVAQKIYQQLQNEVFKEIEPRFRMWDLRPVIVRTIINKKGVLIVDKRPKG
jgi:hypothetical protein